MSTAEGPPSQRWRALSVCWLVRPPSRPSAVLQPPRASFSDRWERPRHPCGWRGRLDVCGVSAGGRGSLARLVGKPGGLVLNLDGDLGQRVRVLAVVVRAEQKLG